jgi:hypothetical protein
MQVRALVTAKDADDIWTVRVTVRERMIRWLTDVHPYALPRVNTAEAILPAGWPNGRPHRPDHDDTDGAITAPTTPLTPDPPRTGPGRG